MVFVFKLRQPLWVDSVIATAAAIAGAGERLLRRLRSVPVASNLPYMMRLLRGKSATRNDTLSKQASYSAIVTKCSKRPRSCKRWAFL